MYICVLCQEGNPLAKKFVLQRGIEEEDLDGAMSIKILRDALLQSADQKGENDIEDNWLLENPGTVGKGSGQGRQGDLRRRQCDQRFAQEPRHCLRPELGAKGNYRADRGGLWKEIKAGAIKAGLYDEATGIGEALGKADETIAAIKGKTLQPTTKEGQAAQKLLLEAVELGCGLCRRL